MDKLTTKHENCGHNPAQITFASVTRPKNSSIIIPNKATVRKLEVKIDQVEQDALSKTIMVIGVSIDSLLQNNLQDMKYNMSGIKSTITSEIGSFITQTFAENDITEVLAIVVLARKHLKVVFASTNMKSLILQAARLNYPTDLTQKHSALLYKLRVIKKDNPAIGSVYQKWFNLLQAPLW